MSSRRKTAALPATMNDLPDTQSESDERELPIDLVGVRDLRFPVQIREKEGALQHTVATVSLAVALPASKIELFGSWMKSDETTSSSV